ncbi:RNA polymerase sigma factor [Arthrobacter sp. NA-172]|uniref:RNA polymerase sigma factor n=1 Tax=Arthrobacter sp. NA-172 TaxID=3367524 RepID=UPI003754EDB2
MARKNLDNPSDADDVVAEAFASVLQSLAAGKGQEQFFRAYLLSTVTRLAHHRNRKSGRTLPTSEETILDHKMTPDDPAIQAFRITNNCPRVPRIAGTVAIGTLVPGRRTDETGRSRSHPGPQTQCRLRPWDAGTGGTAQAIPANARQRDPRG